MLVVDVLPLRTINLLHFTQEVLRYGIAAQNLQDAMRVARSFSQLIAGLNLLTIADQQPNAGSDFVIALSATFPGDPQTTFIPCHTARMASVDNLIAALGQRLANHDFLIVLHQDIPSRRHFVDVVNQFHIGNAHVPHTVNHAQGSDTVNFRHDRFTAGSLASLKQLFNSRQTLGDVTTGRSRTASMECAQR